MFPLPLSLKLSLSLNLSILFSPSFYDPPIGTNLAIWEEGKVVFGDLEALVDLDASPHAQHVALLA